VKRIFSCPVEAAQEVIGGKWKPIILWHLYSANQPCRFGALRRAIPNATEKNDYPFFPILICRDAMCGKAAAQITRHQVGVTTRKCANCPVREAATMLARSAIHVLK
jgi:hypothetical protein